MNDQATATATAASKSLYRKAEPETATLRGPILENPDEHAAAILLVSPWGISGHLTSSGKYLAILPSHGEAMLDDEEGLQAVIVLPAQAPASENHAICMQDAQSARQLALQNTASASAATHTSEPLGTGRGEDGIAVGNLMCKSSGKGLRLR